MSRLSVRVASLATSALSTSTLAVVAVGVLFASPARAADPTTATSGTGEATSVGELIVTGTHIPKPNLDQPTPVEVVPQQILVNSGTLDLGNVIAQLPAMSAQGTIRSNANSFSTVGGEDFADLRNLGTNRTLVLVDGKRHVPGDPNSEAVDLNSIPPSLVDHVEIVTGGASAIYGSDALAGVVNIILKKSFEGVEIDTQAGAFERSAGAYGSFDVTAGHNFADDRGNITVTGLFDHQEQVVAKNIPALKNYGTIVNPNDMTSPGSDVPIANDGKPDFIIVPNVLSEFINTNTVLLDEATFNPLTTFDNAGNPIPQLARVGFNSFAFGSFPNGCASCFDLEQYEDIIPRSDREGGDIRFNYDVLPNVRFSLDAKYIRNEVHDFVQPSFSFGDFQLNPNNAFITPAIQNVLNTLPPGDNTLIARFFGDLGPRSDDIVRETYRIVTGFDGKFDAKFADVTWDASYNYGTTRNHITETGDRITGNFQAAISAVIDPATGKPACEINVPSVAATDPNFAPPTSQVFNPAGCVPYNPFGQQNSQAALNYVSRPLHSFEDLVQQVADVNVSFDSSRFFNLPGGPIGIAMGGEWRQESLENIQDPLVVQGLTEISQTPNASGRFSVYEGYVEANVPIVRHAFLADEISLDVAYRLAHYSTVGQTDAWKVSGIYAPISSLKFRATYSEAVRAPNLTEAFLPPTGTFFTVADPCSAENIGSNANYAANCAAQGIPAGFVAQTNVSPPGEITGNAHLSPEKSTSYTLGFMVEPKFIPNLSLTVDYYNISIKNAINQIAGQDILNNCYSDAGGLNAQFCSLFTRDPTTHNITFITSTYVNASALQTQGVETQASYSYDVSSFTKGTKLSFLTGRASSTFDVNWLYRLRNFPFQDNPTQVQIEEGELGFPEWKALSTFSYSQGRWEFDTTSNFVSAVDRYNKNPGEELPADQIFPMTVGAQWYQNVAIHFRPDVQTTKLDIFFGVNDLFDSTPPENTIVGNPTGPDGSAVYAIGREFFGGVKAKF